MTEKAEKYRFRRRHYFINEALQGRFVISFLIIVMLGGIIISGVLYYLAQGTATASYSYSRLHLVPTSRLILPKLTFASILGVLLMGLASALLSVFHSHRLAGPLYHIEKVLGELCQGNLTSQFRLRKRDQLHQLCQDLNRLSQTYKEKVKAIKGHASESLQLIEKIKVDGHQEIEETLRALEGKVKDLLVQVSYFKVS